VTRPQRHYVFDLNDWAPFLFTAVCTALGAAFILNAAHDMVPGPERTLLFVTGGAMTTGGIMTYTLIEYRRHTARKTSDEPQ
jgi:hypothetical protein